MRPVSTSTPSGSRTRSANASETRTSGATASRSNHLIAAGGTIGAAVFFMIGAPVTGIVVQAFVAGLAAAVIARRSLGGPGGAITFGGLTMVTSWFFAGSIPFLSLFSSWVCFAACGALLGVMSESRRTTDHLV